MDNEFYETELINFKQNLEDKIKELNKPKQPNINIDFVKLDFLLEFYLKLRELDQFLLERNKNFTFT